MRHTLRTDLGAHPPAADGECLLSLLLMSDVQVLDPVSPARCEWVELLADDPLWQPLLHMHRPYEALTHWALDAHVRAARRQPVGPMHGRRHDLALFLGDNIDNAQANELQAFLAIVAGGRTRMPAEGSVHEPDATPTATSAAQAPWPYWCPRADVPDTWKPLGYPAVPDFLARAGAVIDSPGLGLPWAALPGNHDLMIQGTALPDPGTEAIALGARKRLQRPPGFAPADPLTHYVEHPADFSAGGERAVAPDPGRRTLDRHSWIEALVEAGAAGLTPAHAQRGCADAVIDTPHARILLLDTNHPAGDYQGSVGREQLAWLEAQLAEVDAQPGRCALLATHHGSPSIVNTRGSDPQRVHTEALLALLHRHPSLVAWLSGHRHLHEIRAHPGPNGGFWEIATGALIDWPVQGRTVELVRATDGALHLTCTLIDHGAAEGSLAHLHHTLARRFAGTQADRMMGGPGDGNAILPCATRIG